MTARHRDWSPAPPCASAPPWKQPWQPAPPPPVRRPARQLPVLASGAQPASFVASPADTSPGCPPGVPVRTFSYLTRRSGVNVEPPAGDARGGGGDQVKQWLADLTLEEKCRLVGGASSWRTHPIERLGIPEVKMSDGPNGVRGEYTGREGTRAVVVPVGIAQGATWDPEL